MIITILKVSSGNQLGERVFHVEVRKDEQASEFEEHSFRVLPNAEIECPSTTGQIDESQLESLSQADQICRATLQGLSVLSYGSNTQNGLALKLRRKGYSKEVAECAVGYLSGEGYIREEEDVERQIELCLRSGRSRMEIIGKLQSDGYGHEAMKVAAERLSDIDFDDVCELAWERKCRRTPPEGDELRKIVASFYRKGFTKSQIENGFRAFKLKCASGS